jgi:diguanylate cyclase (GGDEF)-like protein/PAS domain S-box-containing protein
MDSSLIDKISLTRLLSHAQVGVVIHDWEGGLAYANPVAESLLRLTPDKRAWSPSSSPTWHFVDEQLRRLPAEAFPVQRVRRSGQPLQAEVLGLIDERGPLPVWFRVDAYCETPGQGRCGWIVVTFVDISAQKYRFAAEDILRNTADVIIVTEAADIDEPLGPKIVYVNKAFELLSGYGASEVIGETPRILQGKDTCPLARQRIRAALLRREPVRETLLNYSKTGHPYWLDMNIMPLLNRFGEVTHFAAIERDVTAERFRAELLEQKNLDLKRLKAQLEDMVQRKTDELRASNLALAHLAYRDALTGLANRRHFFDHAEQQRSLARRVGGCLLMGMVDVDHFKQINDGHGHAVGDLVLVAIACCLGSFFRQEDAHGRIGGEEFAFLVILPEAGHGLALGERLRGAIEALHIPLATGQPLRVTASIGLSLLDAPDDLPLTTLLDRADQAMYTAKQAGRNRVVCWQQGAA